MQENTNNQKPKQIDWINTCKGLGIYLVVLGHSHINPTLQHFLYAFHMPLFFYLSGYVHSIKADTFRFLVKRCIHLLLPYLSFLLVLYPVHSVGVLRHHGWDHQLIWNAVVTALWGGSRLKEAYGVFWFLPCLFFTQQVMNFVLLRFRLWTVSFLVAAGLILAYANARYLPQGMLPLDANVVLAAMPFFYLGVLAKLKAWSGSILSVIAALGTLATLWLVYVKVPVAYNMRDGLYGIPGLSLILAICCIGTLQTLSRMVVLTDFLRRPTAALGVASLGVMFIHKEVMDTPGLVHWWQRHGYIASILITIISYFVTWFLGQFMVTRALFLGSETDFQTLRARAFSSDPSSGRVGSRTSRAA